jgi:NADH-quinone oxidoreductase subunit A
MTEFVGHFLVFTVVSVVFLLLPLIIGMFVRPTLPTREKDEIYECGEPTIGSSYIQFDLRFYVVALLFIVFDVELVFFFPWTTTFGGAMQLADTRLTDAERIGLSEKFLSAPAGSLTLENAVSAEAAMVLGWAALADVMFFFAVLMVGFAYVWKRGDLDWVRAVTQQAKIARPRTTLGPATERPPVLAS